VESATELVQNVSAVALVASVKKRVKRWVRDARFLLKFVARPSLAFKNFLQRADNHIGTLDLKSDCVNSLAYISYALHIGQSRYNRL
jgi:hypothetical protein